MASWVSFGLYVVLSCAEPKLYRAAGEPRLYHGSHIVLADPERTRVLDLPPLLDLGVQCTTMMAIVSGVLTFVCFSRLAWHTRSKSNKEARGEQAVLWSPVVPIVSALIFLVFVSLGVANRHFGVWQAWSLFRP